MCVFIYMYIHIPPNPLYAAHMLMTVKPSSGTWNMFKLPGGHTFRENGFFYPQKLSALSSSSVRGRRLMSSLPQSRLLAELILPRSYRQPQPL